MNLHANLRRLYIETSECLSDLVREEGGGWWKDIFGSNCFVFCNWGDGNQIERKLPVSRPG